MVVLLPVSVCYSVFVMVQVAWLNPTESHYSIQWDDQMCAAGSSEARKLFAKAFKEALTPPEQQVS